MAIASKHVDPVCGTTLQAESAAEEIRHDNQTYHFCSADCAAKFKEDSDLYTARVGAADGAGQALSRGNPRPLPAAGADYPFLP